MSNDKPINKDRWVNIESPRELLVVPEVLKQAARHRYADDMAALYSNVKNPKPVNFTNVDYRVVS